MFKDNILCPTKSILTKNKRLPFDLKLWNGLFYSTGSSVNDASHYDVKNLHSDDKMLICENLPK